MTVATATALPDLWQSPPHSQRSQHPRQPRHPQTAVDVSILPDLSVLSGPDPAAVHAAAATAPATAAHMTAPPIQTRAPAAKTVPAVPSSADDALERAKVRQPRHFGTTSHECFPHIAPHALCNLLY